MYSIISWTTEETDKYWDVYIPCWRAQPPCCNITALHPVGGSSRVQHCKCQHLMSSGYIKQIIGLAPGWWEKGTYCKSLEIRYFMKTLWYNKRTTWVNNRQGSSRPNNNNNKPWEGVPREASVFPDCLPSWGRPSFHSKCECGSTWRRLTSLVVVILHNGLDIISATKTKNETNKTLHHFLFQLKTQQGNKP